MKSKESSPDPFGHNIMTPGLESIEHLPFSSYDSGIESKRNLDIQVFMAVLPCFGL